MNLGGKRRTPIGITNSGKAYFAGIIGGVSGVTTAFTYLAYGNNTTAFAATQTALVGTESQRATATNTRTTTTVSNDTLQLYKVFSITSTETIGECGVFNASSSGTMAARSVVSPSRSVASGDTWTLTYKIICA